MDYAQPIKTGDWVYAVGPNLWTESQKQNFSLSFDWPTLWLISLVFLVNVAIGLAQLRQVKPTANMLHLILDGFDELTGTITVAKATFKHYGWFLPSSMLFLIFQAGFSYQTVMHTQTSLPFNNLDELADLLTSSRFFLAVRYQSHVAQFFEPYPKLKAALLKNPPKTVSSYNGIAELLCGKKPAILFITRRHLDSVAKKCPVLVINEKLAKKQVTYNFESLVLSKHMPHELRLKIKDILLRMYSVDHVKQYVIQKYYPMYELKIAEELANQVEKLKPASLNLLHRVLLFYLCGNIFGIISVGIEFLLSSRSVTTGIWKKRFSIIDIENRETL